MKLFRIENIKLQPLIVIAHNHDDAANIFGHSLIMGLSQRPDADFDIVGVETNMTKAGAVPEEWLEKGYRGIVWSVDDGQGWELQQTNMIEP